MTAKEQAAQALADLDSDVWFDLAEKFTCIEADAVANFLRAYRGDGEADAFLSSHSTGDEVGDLHQPVLDQYGCCVVGWRPRKDEDD